MNYWLYKNVEIILWIFIKCACKKQVFFICITCSSVGLSLFDMNYISSTVEGIKCIFKLKFLA